MPVAHERVRYHDVCQPRHLDLFLSNEYVMAPLVQNTLVSSTSVTFGGAGGGRLAEA